MLCLVTCTLAKDLQEEQTYLRTQYLLNSNKLSDTIRISDHTDISIPRNFFPFFTIST